VNGFGLGNGWQKSCTCFVLIEEPGSQCSPKGRDRHNTKGSYGPTLLLISFPFLWLKLDFVCTSTDANGIMGELSSQ
jgi:hypothetical protein